MPEKISSIPPVYFISDVHLGVGDAEAEARKLTLLLALLTRIRESGGSLFIVGDLFDFWYEYRAVVPRGYHRLYTALEELASSGVRVTYLAGNHDFAIGTFFSEDLGITVLRDDVTFEAGNTRFYVYHGDGLAPKDGGYRALKRVLRSPIAQWGFRLLHPDLGFGLARRFSHTSRGYTSGRDYGEKDGMRMEARRRFAQGTDIVVMGHRHVPRREEIDGGIYVNLGDWIHHFTYAVFRDGEIALYTMIHGFEEQFSE
ncbi:MAG: UDP-2,3-diacylglucosamine diphosphatase [Bacteroidota bacterium]|nr:UDP-2,3-diacylglucosamine diphosphatase [Bacteroidota bacterium]